MRVFFALAALAVAAAGGGGWWLLNRPVAPASGEVLVTVPPGMATRRLAVVLEQEGVVQRRELLLAARIFRPKAKLQAGEYRFAKADTPRGVLDRLIRGDIHYYEVTVREGFNRFEIAALLEAQGLIRGQDFLKVAEDPAPVLDLAPKATSLEGYLFPDTYRLTRATTAEDLARQMHRRFRQVWSNLVPQEGASVHEAVTLASLVEKETGAGSERALVASVFANRLARGMKLDCDPTVIYAALLEGRWRGTIYRSDLDREHPYNTYRNPGLPPGPIASPGRAALEAALRPAESNYLFFVAEPGNSGRHVFSETMADHDAAVARYRSAQKQQEANRQGVLRR
jgi:UPF0755 protein